jgi:hypothetical protein
MGATFRRLINMMDEGYNVYNLDHTAVTERVVNNQIAELKTDISGLVFEMNKFSHSPLEKGFTSDRVEELNYQISKLKLQLDRLTKENVDITLF